MFISVVGLGIEDEGFADEIGESEGGRWKWQQLHRHGNLTKYEITCSHGQVLVRSCYCRRNDQNMTYALDNMQSQWICELHIQFLEEEQNETLLGCNFWVGSFSNTFQCWIVKLHSPSWQIMKLLREWKCSLLRVQTNQKGSFSRLHTAVFDGCRT